MSSITAFEKLILDACLAGDDPRLKVLQAQASEVSVTSREYSSCGAYIDFSVPHQAPQLDSTPIIIGDVNLEVANVPNGLATLLYIYEGKIQFIELATYCDDWPESPEIVQIGYLQENEISADSFELIPVKERDITTITRALNGRQSPNAV